MPLENFGFPEMRGEKSPNAKLTDEMVRQMRQWRSEGVMLREIAVRAGVSLSTAKSVIYRRRWSHV